MNASTRLSGVLALVVMLASACATDSGGLEEGPDSSDETIADDQDALEEEGSEPSEETVEYKLAVVDGAAVASDDPVVQDYGVAPDNLEGKCNNPRERLGDMAVVAQELLANGGVSERLLSILRNVYRSIPADFPVTDCADIFSSYVVLRGGEP